MTADDQDADTTGSEIRGSEVPAPEPELAGDAVEQRCWNCDAPLPEGAMFCGECGSAVGARAARPADQPAVLADEPAETALPPHGDPAMDAAAVDEPEEASEAGDTAADTAADTAVEPAADQSGVPPHGDALLESPPDDTVLERAEADDAPPRSLAEAPPGDARAVDDEAEVEPDADAPDSAPTAVQPVMDHEDGTPPHGDPVATGVGSTDRPAVAEPLSAELPESADDQVDGAELLAPLTAEERFAAERLLDPDSHADKFVLQFSTGESATVYGSGLVGRNPLAEPGEYVDHFVVIRDPGRSVSKTHLEFGQDAGAFWVLDRFSGNGSVLREPEGAPKRCEPGRRYFVPRGTRIEIGDQFFVVS